MPSPAKAIVAGAIIFALGGAMLIGQSLEERGAAVPGAATDATTEPSTFSGEIHATGPRTNGGWKWTPSGMTDPRLDGEAFYSGSGANPTDDTWVGWWTLRIVNDEGAWQGSFPAFSWGLDGIDDDGLGPEVFTALLYGEDTYEGLVAVTVIDIYGNPSGWTVNGVIIDAQMLPQPPAAARPFGSE